MLDGKGKSVGSPDGWIDPLRKAKVEPLDPVYPWGRIEEVLPPDDERYEEEER
ncbi:MAG: hypothetical protein QNJ62_05095 [Methyloceanibacter sp.]|nr:hypothetical protein [Methyloceanibacter sp.]